MRYSLCTMLILLAVLPPVLAATWWGYEKWRAEQNRQDAEWLNKHHPPGAPVIDPTA